MDDTVEALRLEIIDLYTDIRAVQEELEYTTDIDYQVELQKTLTSLLRTRTRMITVLNEYILRKYSVVICKK